MSVICSTHDFAPDDKVLTEQERYRALAAAAHAEFVSLDDVESSRLALRLVPERVARRHIVMPLAVDNAVLTYATSSPFDGQAEHDLAGISGRRPVMRIATRTQIVAAIDRSYAHAAGVAARMVPTPSAKPRVLIAEDEPITRMIVKLLFQKKGFEVLEAENGRIAIEKAGRERPDLLMIDLHMPEMDGFEAIRRIRTDDVLSSLPIIVLTAEEGAGVEQHVLDLGADDYLLKPFDPAVLLSRAQAVFQRLKVAA